MGEFVDGITRIAGNARQLDLHRSQRAMLGIEEHLAVLITKVTALCAMGDAGEDYMMAKAERKPSVEFVTKVDDDLLGSQKDTPATGSPLVMSATASSTSHMTL
eukprot:NODE_7276_length_450_cov_236.455696.p2 GENE.NODE_7276_length_450_cov_236.455696~~NODE_7276_length_450_cov_236.455696.p2  ORF type:complete len:104 (+),score=33.72 NODE_7276_length_450_cov_236.455696:3-314(+)